MFIGFNAFLMPSLAGDTNTTPIDLQFAYTPDEAYALIESYGEDVRKRYIIGELTLDVAYPITYTLMLSISLFLIYQRSVKMGQLPYIIFLSDMLENMGIVTMLANYPSQLTAVAWVTSVFSTVKWLMVGACMIVLIIGLIRKILSKSTP